MALGNPVQIRLSAEKQISYEEEAERLGKPLATYIRERLESGDDMRAEVAALRNEVGGEVAALRRDVAGVHHKIEDIRASGDGRPENDAGKPAADAGVLIELLLLLRAAAAPDRMSMIHAELRRLGFDVWTYNHGKS